MTFHLANFDSLLQRLSAGWPAGSESPHEFSNVWRERLACTVKPSAAEAGVYHWTAELGDLRLRGTDEVHCFLVAGSGTSFLTQFRQVAAPGRLVVVCVLSEGVLATITGTDLLRRTPVLSRLDIRAMFSHTEPRAAFAAHLRKKLPLRGLIPFNHLLAVPNNMFYGRSSEVGRLLADEESSFAIAGPSRIGKTSLVKQYQRELIRTSSPLVGCTFYVDYYECPGRRDADLVHFTAMRVDGTTHASRANPENFPQFIRYLRGKVNNIPTLIMDETDEICRTGFVQQLITLAKNNQCRLIMCGRGELLTAALESNSPLAQRLSLVRLKALEDSVARRLLCEPLSDLGLHLDDPVVDRVLRLTGCFPHLIQFFGKRLAEFCADNSRQQVTVDVLEEIRWDFETAQYFTSPLADIRDRLTLLTAMSLLKTQPAAVTYALVVDCLAKQNISISPLDAKRICNELVILNVLAWTGDSVHAARSKEEEQTGSGRGTADKGAEDSTHLGVGTYRLANEALAEYAERTGLLADSMDRVADTARRSYGRQPI